MFFFRRCFKILVRRISTSKPNQAPFQDRVHDAFDKHLLVTNTLTAGTLMSLGDLFQQEHTYQQGNLPKRYDYERLTRMFVTGVSLGPLQHYFYHWLAKFITDNSMKGIFKKIMLDQLIMSPVSIGVFFTSMCLLELKPFMVCADELADKFLHVYLVDWCIGPAAQVINFRYIPVKYQVIYVNVVAMIYSIYLSYVKHN